MTERTSPTDAIDRLAWVLNYAGEGTQSLNSLAEQSHLSWATVRKYVAAIETVQKIAPEIAVSADGVEVGSRSKAMADMIKDPAAALTVYLLTQAEVQGGADKPINKELCEGIDGELESALRHAVELGWASEVGTDEIKLTPTGIRVAGPARAEVQNFDHRSSGSELHIHQEGTEEVIALADEGAGSSEERRQSGKYDADNYRNPVIDEGSENRCSYPGDRSGYPSAA